MIAASLTLGSAHFIQEDDMRKTVISLSVVALGAVGASAAVAQDVGAGLYASYCAACHGDSAKGDGDMANVMTIPSPNLTLLAKNNDGVYPLLDVIHIIDGRTGVRSHGGVMPVFGTAFSADGPSEADPYGSVLVSRGRVLSVATYLEIAASQVDNGAPGARQRRSRGLDARGDGALPDRNCSGHNFLRAVLCPLAPTWPPCIQIPLTGRPHATTPWPSPASGALAFCR